MYPLYPFVTFVVDLSRSIKSRNETQIHQPCNLLVLPLPRLHLQTLIVHLVHIARSLHIAQNVILQVADGLQGVGHVLVLLDVTDDFGGFGALGEVDEVGAPDDGGDAVFDEG